ncbi:RmlC-like cupin domain-containing protein [Phlebopus sp. FC_14]|nr:RmlC-like cupin domain-containing protein [Phlebopus sp. FC_14]
MPARDSIKIVPRFSADRGQADHGWLKTFHTFSFANYYDPRHESFGSLRVLNEDRVAPRTGFGTHSHQQFEIFSYVVSGKLEHRDSMGNTEVLSRGALQMTSTGTGISHSEKANGPQQVHFCQIWAMPRAGQGRGKPAYFTRNFTDEEKKNRFALVVAPDNAPEVTLNREDSGPAPVRSQLWMYASLIERGVSLSHVPAGKGQKKGYIHVIQKSGYNPGKAGGASVRVGSEADGPKLELREGDGAYMMYESGAELKIENDGQSVAEVLLFDIE